MAQHRVLPVLPLDDAVVLPGMVVSLDLADDETRAAVDAARAGGAPGASDARAPGVSSRPAGGGAQVLLVPRIDGQLAQVAAVGVIEQTGRLPRGGSAAVVRGTSRVSVVALRPAPPAPDAEAAAGDAGAGDAVKVRWAEVRDLEAGADEGAQGLAREYRALLTSSPA